MAAPGVEKGDTIFFNEMRDFFVKNDLSQPGNFQIVAEKYVDIDNYIDYMILSTWGTIPNIVPIPTEKIPALSFISTLRRILLLKIFY